MGDLRPYGLMQLAPMLLIPLSLRLYAPRYSGDRDIMAVLGLYGLALLFDLGDRPVFEFSGGLVSGGRAQRARPVVQCGRFRPPAAGLARRGPRDPGRGPGRLAGRSADLAVKTAMRECTGATPAPACRQR